MSDTLPPIDELAKERRRAGRTLGQPVQYRPPNTILPGNDLHELAVEFCTKAAALGLQFTEDESRGRELSGVQIEAVSTRTTVETVTIEPLFVDGLTGQVLTSVTSMPRYSSLDVLKSNDVDVDKLKAAIPEAMVAKLISYDRLNG